MPGARAVEKGRFDVDKGGLAELLSRGNERQQQQSAEEPAPGEPSLGGVPEAIDFSAHSQTVLSKFAGATQVDWRETEDHVLSQDTWWRFYVQKWTKHCGKEKADAFLAITALLLQLSNVYLVNPYRRNTASTAVQHASSDLKNKVLRAGWWQDAVKKMVTRDQVEEVPFLKTLAATINVHGLSKFHVRNMTNSFVRQCTFQQPPTVDQFFRDADYIWGSWVYLQLELIGEEREAAMRSASHLGKALGIIYGLQSLVHTEFTHCALLPRDLMRANNVDLELWQHHEFNPAMSAFVEHMLTLAAGEQAMARDSAVPLGLRGGYLYRDLILQLPFAEIEAVTRACVKMRMNVAPKEPQDALLFEQQIQLWRRLRALWKRMTFVTRLGVA